MTQELLRLHNAQVKFDGQVALDIDDFVINEGEHVVVLGPNGSGKSTLINLLTREVEPVEREEPSVFFMGKPNATSEEVDKTIGVVSTAIQERMLVHRTVHDIVLGGFFGSVGVPFHIGASDEQVDLAYKAIREIGIPSLAERDMLTLSTGQMRRALIARALINAPDVLVFDEPTVGLDPEAAWNLRQSLDALANAGHTMLIITHDVGDIMPGFERVCMLQDAHIVADGPKEEMLTTQRLRRLFGVPITLVENEGRYHLQ